MILIYALYVHKRIDIYEINHDMLYEYDPKVIEQVEILNINVIDYLIVYKRFYYLR
jgi:hypothetical protein